METRVSLEDLTPLAQALSISQFRWELTTLYTWMAKVDSHYSFVSTCLRYHAIPKGLSINIQPCVPKSPCREFAIRLEKEWALVMKQVTRGLLTALKHYHGSCAHHLQLLASNVETSTTSQLGRANATPLLEWAKDVCEKQHHQLPERCKKKLNKLLLPNSHQILNTILKTTVQVQEETHNNIAIK